MKTVETEKGYLLITHGSSSAKIYSRLRKKNGAQYEEHALVYHEGSKRVRRYFADARSAKDEAERVLIAMANGATRALTLSNVEAQEYALAVAELKHVNAALLPAAKEYRTCVEMLRGKALLSEAVRYFMESGFSDVVPITVPAAVAEMLLDKEKDRRSAVHLSDLKYRLGRFAKEFPLPIASVTKAQIADWLRGLEASPRSRNNFAAAVTSLFRWAASDEKKYLAPGRPTAADNLPRADETDADSEDVVVYTPAEIRSIFDRVAPARPELIPFLAMGAFAGLRTAEIERLDWAQVDFEQGHIEIKKGRAKTRTRRLVPIQPNLSKWLAAYKGSTGPVCPFSRTQHILQRLVETSLSADAPAQDWKRNGLRHSFGTYRLAIVKSEQQVAGEMGNSPAMLYANYRGIVTEAQARQYWAIEPS